MGRVNHPPEVELQGQRPQRYLEESEPDQSSEEQERPDQNTILQVLHAVEERTEPYVMSGETMKWVAFNAKVQTVRLVVLVVLLLTCMNLEVKTKMSELDKAWMVEFL